MAVFLSQRWRRQPSGPQEINSGHWATAALIHSFVPWPSLVEPATKLVWGKTGSPTIGYGGQNTPAFVANTAIANYYSTPDSVRNSPTKIMIVARVKLNAVAGQLNSTIVAKFYDGTTAPYVLGTRVGSGNDSYGMGFFTAAAWSSSGAVTEVGATGWHQIAGTYDGATLAYYIDRRLDSSAAVAGSLPDNAQAVTVGTYFTTVGWDGQIEYVHIFDGTKIPVTMSAVMALQEAPYAIFRPQQRRLYVSAPAVTTKFRKTFSSIGSRTGVRQTHGWS